MADGDGYGYGSWRWLMAMAMNPLNASTHQRINLRPLPFAL